VDVLQRLDGGARIGVMIAAAPSLVLPAGAAGSQIVGLGHHQPEKVLTNDDIARLVETNDEWIRSRTGIVTRHVAADDVTVADMATAAAEQALADAGVSAAELDLVVVATATAVDRSPNTAGRVAYALPTGVHPGASPPVG
jgi:3-oxoacyl-[acyl-carrier-protein] synthase-3